MDELRALGVDQDLRVIRHLNKYQRPDASGHLPVLIEAISEGVVFTTAEHSIVVRSRRP